MPPDAMNAAATEGTPPRRFRDCIFLIPCSDPMSFMNVFQWTLAGNLSSNPAWKFLIAITIAFEKLIRIKRTLPEIFCSVEMIS